jgi:hypothetical protein
MSAFLTKAGNLTGLTDINLARQNINLSTTDTPVFGGVDIEGSGGNYAYLRPTSLSIIQPGHGQFLFQPSQGIVFPDASVQTTAWNDAPSNGTIYGRKDGDWVEAGGGDYLPLAGGAMDANASITIADTSTATDSEVAGWGLGVQLSADHAKGTTVEFDGLNVYDGASQVQVTPTGITFPDSTVQTTAATTPDLSGYLTKAGNLTGLANTTTARTNLGLGTMATATASDYLTKAGNLSGLSNVTTARNNLSLGSDNNVSFNTVSKATGGSDIGDTARSYSLGINSVFGGSLSLSKLIYSDNGGDPSASYVSDYKLGNYYSTGIDIQNTTLDVAGAEQDGYRFRIGGEVNSGIYVNQWTAGVGSGYTIIPGQIVLTSESSGSFTIDTTTGITFPDTTVQTTAAVTPDLTGYAPLASPAFTGNPTAPTATFGDDDTSIATTAFVQAGLLGGTAVARNLEVYVRNQSGASIPAGSIVYISGATGNRPLITLSQANNDANSAQTMGFTKTVIANNAFGYVIVRGEVENLNTSALTEGDQLYLSPTVAGGYTTTKPVAPQHLVYVGIVIRSHPTLGTILVAVQNGYELGEIHDVLLTTPANNDLLAYESSTDLWKNKSASTLGLAPLASPTFTGTPSLPTGTTGVTQTAGNNTTALATTAFVTAAVPAFATNAQARTSSNTTTALSPSSSIWQHMSAAFMDMLRTSFTYTAVGTMGAVQAVTLGTRILLGTVGACSGRTRVFGTSQIDQSFSMMSKTTTYGINFSKPTWCSGRAWPDSAAITDPNVTAAWYFGKSEANGAGELNRKGFGWEIIGNATTRYLTLAVHDGTTLTKVTSSYVVVSGTIFDWDVVSDGAGNVTLYVEGVSVATTALGPTGDTGYSGTRPVIWQEELRTTATTSAFSFVFSRGRIYMPL